VLTASGIDPLGGTVRDTDSVYATITVDESKIYLPYIVKRY
jgi:hypothetical protein